MEKVKLNISIEISKEKYDLLMFNLKDVSGCDKKEDLEEYISDGLEFDIMENDFEFLFDN